VRLAVTAFSLIGGDVRIAIVALFGPTAILRFFAAIGNGKTMHAVEFCRTVSFRLFERVGRLAPDLVGEDLVAGRDEERVRFFRRRW
jgi:hypothetical protein